MFFTLKKDLEVLISKRYLELFLLNCFTEILEEKSALKNVDPGNPNWEFLSMIREYQEQVEFNPLQDGDAAYIDHQVS